MLLLAAFACFILPGPADFLLSG